MEKATMTPLMDQDGLPWRVYWRWIAELAARGDHLVSVRFKDYLRAIRAREAQDEAIGDEGLSE
jgi:hypothetical protein